MPNLLRKISSKQKTLKTDTPINNSVVMPNKNEPIYPLQYVVGSGQSIGLKRDHNEDALFTLSSILSDGQSEEQFGLYVIADGMGGHRNGEVASSSAIRAVVRHVIDHIYKNLMESQPNFSSINLEEILVGAVDEAQKAVKQHAPGGGTTLTIALLLKDQLTISHVGDSRAYLVLSNGDIVKITRDHSLVQRLIDLKEIEPEEAEKHPQKNILLKAIGQAEPLQADTLTLELQNQEGLLMCSDGLWGVVNDSLISSELHKGEDPVTTCNALIDLANKNGGPDNISVIYVKITDHQAGV